MQPDWHPIHLRSAVIFAGSPKYLLAHPNIDARPLTPIEDLKDWHNQLWDPYLDFLDFLVEREIEHCWSVDEFVDVARHQRFTRFLVEIRRESDLVMVKMHYPEIKLALPLSQIISMYAVGEDIDSADIDNLETNLWSRA